MSNTLQKTNFRKKVAILEQIAIDNGALVGKDTEQLCPVNHSFADGMYMREIFMPKGTFVSSKIHKTNHFYFVMTGKVTVITENGRQEIKAPYVGMTKAGTKRALLIRENCNWITVHATDKVNVDEIEKDIIEESFAGISFDIKEEQLCHLQ